MLGLWRVGSRYRDDTFKAAAILLIIPLLQIVRYVLILIGSESAKNKIGCNVPS